MTIRHFLGKRGAKVSAAFASAALLLSACGGGAAQSAASSDAPTDKAASEAPAPAESGEKIKVGVSMLPRPLSVGSLTAMPLRKVWKQQAMRLTCSSLTTTFPPKPSRSTR